jgi:hypothetical protein
LATWGPTWVQIVLKKVTVPLMECPCDCGEKVVGFLGYFDVLGDPLPGKAALFQLKNVSQVAQQAVAPSRAAVGSTGRLSIFGGVLSVAPSAVQAESARGLFTKWSCSPGSALPSQDMSWAASLAATHSLGIAGRAALRRPQPRDGYSRVAHQLNRVTLVGLVALGCRPAAAPGSEQAAQVSRHKGCLSGAALS